MSEPRWISVDPNRYDEPHEVGMADLEMHIFISPFDIPRRVRGYFDEKRDLFVIEFKYITREPTKKKKIGPEGVVTIVGKRTGRILGFHIDVNRLSATSVALRLSAVQKAIKAVRGEHEPPSKPWPSRIQLNSHVADQVLQDSKDEVFAK